LPQGRTGKTPWFLGAKNRRGKGRPAGGGGGGGGGGAGGRGQTESNLPQNPSSAAEANFSGRPPRGRFMPAVGGLAAKFRARQKARSDGACRKGDRPFLGPWLFENPFGGALPARLGGGGIFSVSLGGACFWGAAFQVPPRAKQRPGGAEYVNRFAEGIFLPPAWPTPGREGGNPKRQQFLGSRPAFGGWGVAGIGWGLVLSKLW